MIANSSNIASSGFPFFLSLVSSLKELVRMLIKLGPMKTCEKKHEALTVHGPSGEGNKLSKDGVKAVMKSLGVSISDNDQSDRFVEEEDVLRIFNEEEPSLDELKEAFDVFDENGDGFVDASELGRVLVELGFVKECRNSECMRMIKAVDGNEDGVIDFSEFVSFMETCFSN